MAGHTALRAIRDVGRVQAGHRVLINGAAGGVGTFAVQIATAFGIEVTGICSTRNVGLVRSLGAANVIDHTKDDFPDGREPYDVILDDVGNQPLRRLRQALTSTGTLVSNAGGSPSGTLFGPITRVIAVSVLARQRLRRCRTRGNGNTCSPSPTSSRAECSRPSSAGPTPWPTPLPACATWRTGMRAARPSSP